MLSDFKKVIFHYFNILYLFILSIWIYRTFNILYDTVRTSLKTILLFVIKGIQNTLT